MRRPWIGLVVLGACGEAADSGWAEPPLALTFGEDDPYVSSLEPMGDATGDGIDDLVVLGTKYSEEEEGGVRLYLYEGAPGGPDDWPDASVAVLADRGVADPVGDVDGDGLGDLALALRPDREMATRLVLYSSASGGLNGSVAELFDGALLNDRRELSTEVCGRADLDGDGVRELVGVGVDTVELGEATVFVFEGAQSPPALLSAGGLTEPWTASAGDLDGDGRDDLALIEVYEPEIALMLGGPVIDALETLPGPDLSAHDFVANVANPGDLDGDGQAELAIGLRDDAAEVPLYALHDGALERVDGRASPTTRGDSFGEELAAMPLQGEPGLLIADAFVDWGQGAVFLYRGAETSPSQSFAAGGEFWGTGRHLEAVGDLNADGAPDLAFAQEAIEFDLRWVMALFPRP